ncbi:MAG: efflux RND transporter permease subunit [Planctomycetes bacterium]|nr:efflux RND transporter permease subunit [Planctomycetota bacterium]
MSLPRFSVRNPVLVNLLMMVIIISGMISALTLTREMFPESRPEKLLITTIYPGVSPQEIEKVLTVKIEEAVRDVEGVDEVDSTIIEGMSLTRLSLLPGTRNVDRVLQDVKAEIDAIEDLPADAEKSTIKKLEPKLPVIAVAVYGAGSDADRKRAARSMRDELLLLPGVSDVVMNGAKDDEISVEIRPAKLMEYDITFDDVATAIRQANLDVTGGQIDASRSSLSIRTLGEEQRGVDLNKIIVRSLADGRTVYLSDVASVQDAFVDIDQEGYFNGEPSINCVVHQNTGQDAIRISQLVKAYILAKKGLPFDPYGLDDAANQPWYWRPFAIVWAHGSRLANLAIGHPDPEIYYQKSLSKPFDHKFKVALHTDLARFVEGRIALMVDNGLQGLFLILLTLVLFLDRRVAFWAATGLPVTFLGTFLMMSLMGVSLNLVSLMGLIIVLSIDVDEAIVMGENVYRRMQEGLPPDVAAIEGSEEVMWPIVVMTGTTIGAFIPLLFIKGQLGDFLKELPMVCIAAMSMSMLEALVILPTHLGHLKVPARTSKGTWSGGESATIDSGFAHIWNRVVVTKDRVLGVVVDVWYDRLIRLLLRWRYVTLASAVATLSVAIGLVLGGIVPFVPVPKMDSETLVGSLEMSIGTPVELTRDRLKQLSDHLTSLPEVVNVQMLVGIQVDIAGEGAVGQNLGSHLGQLIVELKEAHRRSRTSEAILIELRQQAEQLSGVNAVTWSSLNGGPAGRALELNVSADRFEDSLAAAQAIREKLVTYDGVFDIDDNVNARLREMQLRLHETARPTGITVATLGHEVRNAFFGREARRISRNREDVKIMVRYPKEYRQDDSMLEAMWIPSPPNVLGKHNWVPLSEVAELTEDRAHDSIQRSEFRRAISIYADVDDQHNDNEISASIQNWINTELRDQHPGVRVSMRGKTLENKKFMDSMLIAFPISLGIIYVLLTALFRSYIQPIVVLIAVPFGVQGAIVGHWIMGYDLTIMSAIGLVALNGIVVNDSLVLVDFINNRVRSGMSHFESSVAGSKLRMRAIVLNTITAVVGMSPLMFETSFQAKFLIPLAVTLTWGLIFATVLTLVVVPAINMVFFDIARLTGLAQDASDGDEQSDGH